MSFLLRRSTAAQRLRGRGRRAWVLALVVGLAVVAADSGAGVSAAARHRSLQHVLSRPAPLVPFVLPALAGEGQWHPAGRFVHGTPAVYETDLRPPGGGPVAGIAWMDTRLLAARLYSGSVSPGPGPWHYTAPIQAPEARSLVAAFNGGFKTPVSGGGYYSEGRIAAPLRVGAASLIIDRNGSATVATWGPADHVGGNVASVRQNLTLIVDAGRPVPGLNPADHSVWGATLGGGADVWRSGLGQTRDGALVYVAGPTLNVLTLAQLLARAGAERAMTLDMNPYWTVFATYAPRPGAAASPANGTDLLASMVGQPDRFFTSWWARDFVTMSAR